MDLNHWAGENMKRIKIFGKSAIVASLFVASLAQANSTYELDSLWTGDNRFSSAPAPVCPCDIDVNQADCPEQFSAENFSEEICYDEFLPAGSHGWAHGKKYRLKTTN